jgi:hypothetical protein
MASIDFCFVRKIREPDRGTPPRFQNGLAGRARDRYNAVGVV